MTKMGSIVGHRIDYNGVGALREASGTYTAKLDPSTPPPDSYTYINGLASYLCRHSDRERNGCLVFGVWRLV